MEILEKHNFFIFYKKIQIVFHFQMWISDTAGNWSFDEDKNQKHYRFLNKTWNSIETQNML